MKSSRTINIKHLYAREMNVYGDNGNVVVLKSRLERRGYEVSVGQVNREGQRYYMTPVTTE